MWLLALLVIVFIIIVFVLGSYSTKGSLGPAPYPTATELAQNIQSCCGVTPACKSTPPQGTSSSSAGCAAPVDPCKKPCRKHRKKCCNVCKESSDDGFSTGIAFISTPAPF
jgi:hypothetical protein